MTTFTEIPTIDLSPLHDNTLEAFSVIAKEIKKTYSTVGFAYLINHGISQALIDSTFAAARDFHQLPYEEKLKIKQNKHFRGYMSNRESFFEISTLGKATKPNQSEAFIIAHEVAENDPDYIAGINLAGKNQWPEQLPNFQKTVSAYNQALYLLARKLLKVFSLAFGLDLDGLEPFFKRPTTFLRLQYYPEQPNHIPEDQFGIAPHTDYGFLTLLAQDNVGGLQVKNQSGAWIEAPPLSGSFMLNSGDMLKRMTNDTFISTPHRVINRSGKKRFSIPFFFEPDMHAPITPFATFCQGNNQAKYPTIEYAEHLMARIRSNYNIGA